jgi:RimJ/RimL family protein N-acetyltransferase
MSAIPILHTERLTLRAHTPADFEEYAAMWADPLVTRYIGGRPNTREDSWARFLRFPGHWQFVGLGCWAAREKASGRYVGDFGFFNMKRDFQPGFGSTPEAGWALATWSHGKGYATEAMRAVHDWLERAQPGTRTACMINPPNAASIKVATKLGYREYGRATYKNDPVILFERAAP